MQFESKVRDLSQDGLGVIDHPDGRVFFVSGAWPGDTGMFEVTQEKPRYGFARMVRISNPSPERVTPDCQNQGHRETDCGGCPWMIANYEAQLRYKKRSIQLALKRAGIEAPVLSIIPASRTQGYRNRAQFKTDGRKLGYVAERSNRIVNVQTCSILNKACQSQLTELRSRLPMEEWTPPQNHPWNFIDIDDHESSAPEGIILNRRLPFRQGNTEQNLQIKNWLYEQIKGQKYTHALELFCGNGNLTGELVRAQIPKITAYEANQISIDQLRKNGWETVQSETKDLYRITPKQGTRGARNTDLLVLDPPRSGFSKLPQWVSLLRKLRTILYISCSPQTWTRDIRSLCQSDWRVDVVRPIDLFPHTPHIEVLCLLSRESRDGRGSPVL